MYAALMACGLWLLYNFVAKINGFFSLDLFLGMHYLLDAVESTCVKWGFPIGLIDVLVVVTWLAMKNAKEFRTELNDCARVLLYVSIAMSFAVMI